MPRHRARSTHRTAWRLAGAAAVAGSALAALSGAAQAATLGPPDLAPLPTERNDAAPDPAPQAPPVEPSYTAFESDDPISRLRDFTPAGIPAAGIVDVLGDVPQKLVPSGGGAGGAGYE